MIFLTLFDLYVEEKIATIFNTNSIIYDLEIIKNAEFHFWKIIELQGIKKQLFCIFFICWYFVNTKWMQTWVVMRLKKRVLFKKKKKRERGFIFQHTLIEILTLFLNSILAAIWADAFLLLTDPGAL